MSRREGQYYIEDFHILNGGLNTSDSPFVVDRTMCVGGKNFDFRKRGAVQKRLGHLKLNSSANAQTKTLGLGQWDRTGGSRKVLRASGTKLQEFNTSSYAFTNLTEDTTTATSSFLPGTSTQPVVTAMFNDPNAGCLWAAGGGMSAIYGMYSGTKVTENGVPTPGGTITVANSPAGGTWGATGYYRYAVAFRKTSTQATSNAVLFTEVHITDTTKQVRVDLAALTGVDTAKYDKIYLYRSSYSSSTQGNTAFTAGDLVALIDSSVPGSGTTYYDDSGSANYVSTSISVPQADSTVADQSVLPTKTYTSLAVFKRRLVTAYNNTVRFSDINQDEYWPTYQTITLPTGGDITAVATLSFTSPVSADVDEYLCVFQQRAIWVITGDGVITSGIPNWSLKFISSAGAIGQSSIVAADGFLAWVNYRGFYLWNGNGKPRYISKRIEDKFALAGDIDKTKLGSAWGIYCEGRGEIQWVLSSKTYGEQQLSLKLDLDATIKAPNGGDMYEGVFSPDALGFSAYAGVSFLSASTSTDETYYYGDGSGYVYSGYSSPYDGGAFVDFQYITPYLWPAGPSSTMRVHKVVAYVHDKGTYDLTLNYWTNYRSTAAEGGTRSLSISPGTEGNTGAVWGSATWGAGTTWGSVGSRPRTVTFKLSDTNSEGDCIKLQFSQTSSTKPCIFYGFSIYYTLIGDRK